MHVAVVDDSFATRTILGNMLRECGCRVSEAADEDAALTLLRSRADIQVVLIDWQLAPRGGYELTRHLRENARFANRRIIMVTAEAGVDEVANALEVGIDDYLTKPFNLQNLREKLDLLRMMAA
jgi:DNA-binding response OmpR family regulator